MAYSKQNFQNGQTLDAANLETMENGIIAGQGVKNLLINSNFKDPINSSGKTSWSSSGITIDKWRTSSTVTVNLTSSGITVDATSVAGNFQQNIDNLPNGTYTFAALVNNVIRTIVFTNDNGTITTVDNSNASFGGGGSINAGKESNAYYVQINNVQGYTNTIAWAALYEGNYAVDTLPNYIPKDKHIEMSNCGIPAQPYNLFDNSNFRDPVNSRNIISTSDAGYHIDRWKKDNTNGTVVVGDGYLAMNGTGAQWFLTQHISTDKIKSGAVYTIALADTSGSISVCSTVMSTNMAKFTAQHTFANGAVVTTNVEYTSDKYSVYFTSNSDARTRFAWAALYEGSYTADTLPPYVPKDKNVEIINCGIPLQPENLLVNSNFSDPVAPKGLNSRESYTTPGTLYLCDGWIGSEGIIAEQQSDGIKLTTTSDGSYITKYLNLQIGKTYTLALCASDISSQHRIELYDTETYGLITQRTSSDEILVINFRNSYDKIMMTYRPGYSNEGGSSVLKWAALYEGSYTAETLPGYVPKDKYIEMLNCGISLAPRNLLNNSDFRDPVNSQGKTKYTGDTNAINKWTLSGGSASTLTLVNHYARLAAGQASTAMLTQYISDLRDGVYTQALNLAGTIYTRIIKLSSSTITTIDESNAAYDSGHIDCSVDSSGNYSFNFSTSNGIDILWAALYEGAYTINTLPAYVPKGKLVEMINCGAPLQPKNLLDNSDFSNPVNHRGAASYTGSGYTIDRWRTWDDGFSITIDDSSISFSGGSLVQYLQKDTSGIHTIAAMTNSGTLYVYTADIGEAVSYSGNLGMGRDSNGTNVVSLAPGTYIWAALYEGAYTVDTLPPYIPKDKHVEMLNCGIPTSPRNILKNSDFTNPLNTNGFSSISSGSYTTIDCWNSWISGNGGKIELTSSGIKLSPPSSENIGIYQQIENYQLNKIYTVVVYINDLPYLKSFQMGNYGVGTNLGPVYFYSIPSANVLIRINSTDSEITIQKVALYEGAYTLDTIPMYQSESRHVEMLNCNVPLAPYNLLDNSDFSNPIAQAGLNGMHGSMKYVCDRWISWDADATFGSGYITPGSPIDQHLSKTVIDINKTYTAAICLSDGTIKAESGTFSNGFGSYPLGIYCMQQTDSNVYVTVRLSEGNNIRWVALYEGAYTVDTLPPYVPKGKHVEMLNCGVPLQPRNLLDNSDFRIAQAGYGGMHGTQKYACDRWYDTYGFGTFSFDESQGLTVAYGTNHAYLVQKINNASQYHNKTMTVALQLSDGTIYVNSGTYLSSGISFRISTSNWLCDLHPDRIELVVTSDSITIKWIALYEGAYTVDTLPPYVPKDKHVEMLNCGVPLQPHNLLDNSNFRDPVNSRGKNTYSDAGNEYTIDRWKTQYGTNISIENGYINIFGNWELYQHIQNPKDGIYTFAARIRINSVGQHTPNIYVNDGSGIGNELSLDANTGEWKTYILRHDLSSTTAETISFSLSPRGGDTTASISAEWAAMYKGAYTADTLPPYIPKDKHVEMLNCGVSLAPHNLLDNSNFSDPVNQLGLTSFTPIGKKNIDRWETNLGNNSTITIGNGKITISKSATGGHFAQTIPVDLTGKMMTYAVKTANGITCKSAIISSSSSFAQIDGVKAYLGVYASGGETFFQIYFNTTDSITLDLYWAALYEGSYTADTLPPYVPKDKRVEMLSCGVQLNPRNLLDNSDFLNPINQRGKTSYTNNGYTIDRWKDSSNATTIIAGIGLTLQNDNTTSNAYWRQRVPAKTLTDGKMYTMAINISGNVFCGAATIDASNQVTFYGANGLYLACTGYTSPLYWTIQIAVSPGKSFSGVSWVALYEGLYTVDTLPAYQPKGYTTELIECQRYYRTMSYPVIPCANNSAGKQVCGFLPFRMRIDSSSVYGSQLYYFKGDTTFYNVTTMSATSYGAGTRITFNLSQDVEGNLAGAVAGNKITFDADL